MVAPAVVVAEPVCKEQNKFVRGEFSAAAVKYMHLTLEPNNLLQWSTVGSSQETNKRQAFILSFLNDSERN